MVDLLTCRQGELGRHRHIEIWKAVPHCLMWCLWRERNMRTFEDIERNALELKLTFFRTLFDWMTAIELFSFISFLEFFFIFVLFDCNSLVLEYTPSVLWNPS